MFTSPYGRETFSVNINVNALPKKVLLFFFCLFVFSFFILELLTDIS